MERMSVATKPFGTEGDEHGGPPRTLGRYRIAERIGSGGTADVFRAEVEGASGFAKTLVVKCLRPASAEEPELARGLAREAKLAQRLHHGNIVQVLDFGIEDDQPYVVMEHVDGCSLHELSRDLRRRRERMGLEEALFVVEELAAALRYVHGLTDDDGTPLHLVHRDVKPRNALVSREGVVKLTDFGIAKLSDAHGDTLPGVVKGTPAYLAPEQARGLGVDARTDVFALGLVLRELVGGDDPEAPPPDPRVDAALREVWQRAAAEVPAERFADVQSLLRALQRWRAARELEAGPGRLPAWVRRARRQAPVAVPVALDAALLGSRERGVTVSNAAAPTSTPAREPAALLHRGWMGLGIAFTLGGVAMATWAVEPRPAPELAARPTAAAAIPSPAYDERDRAPVAIPPDLAEEAPPHELTHEALPPAPITISTATATVPEPTTEVPAPQPARRRDPPRLAATPGRLQVNVLPWAEVFVDGRSRGRVPIDIELPPGHHRIRLHNPQLGEHTLESELPAGGVHKISRW
jgi:tRNA A-37 threonylcarbamoyl transferase component Bud32